MHLYVDMSRASHHLINHSPKPMQRFFPQKDYPNFLNFYMSLVRVFFLLFILSVFFQFFFCSNAKTTHRQPQSFITLSRERKSNWILRYITLRVVLWFLFHRFWFILRWMSLHQFYCFFYFFFIYQHQLLVNAIIRIPSELLTIHSTKHTWFCWCYYILSLLFLLLVPIAKHCIKFDI